MKLGTRVLLLAGEILEDLEKLPGEHADVAEEELSGLIGLARTVRQRGTGTVSYGQQEALEDGSLLLGELRALAGRRVEPARAMRIVRQGR